MPQVVVDSQQSVPYSVTLSARDHRWLSDEPADRGGADRGPTPVEMLIGAVGACIAITVSMYAGRKSWPLQKVQVRLEYQRLLPEAGAAAEVMIDLGLIGELSEEQRRRLFEIAGRCPVKRAIEGGIRFQSSLVSGD